MARSGTLDPNYTAPIAPTKPPFAFGSPETFSTAVGTQAGDYDRIMGEYDNLIRTSRNNIATGSGGGNQAENFLSAPRLSTYHQSDNVTGSLANLSELSRTGGYSGNDIQNIRARALSPVRSIYANAQRGLNQSKTLQGGYSPNFTAASAKMARELSEQLGQRTTDVEGQIAQNQASNRLSIAPSWASASRGADDARMAVDRANQDAVNRVNEMNANIASQNRAQRVDQHNREQSNILAGIEGQRGLYGTTPALVSTFGNQVSQATSSNQQQQQLDQQRRNDEFRRQQEQTNTAASFLR